MLKIYMPQKNGKYSFEQLVEIVRTLRMPGGCPWDIEQNHHSIRNDFIEETYEAVDAIDRENNTDMCEEFGDVMLQVVFHSQIATEDNAFNVDDVIDGICKKLVLRHPHVFGDVKAETSEQVLSNWDKIKKQEKNQSTYTDTLESVPMAYPALMRSQKVQKRAAKAGFDWKDASGPVEKLQEECRELSEAVKSGNSDDILEEYGDFLFSAVNISRHLKVDSEQALNQATDKFIRRFAMVESMALQDGKDMKKMSLEELDKLWNKAKNSIQTD